jgi:O-antigen/teichoic acid export membrane protein
MGRYLGAGDLGLYRMTTTLYGIAMLVAAIGIPAAMIK